MDVSRSITPSVHAILTQDPDSEESRPVEHSVVNDPRSKSYSPSDPPKSLETEAASTLKLMHSVILAVQSSIDAATRQQSQFEQTQSPDLPATRTGLARTPDQPSDNIRSSVSVDTADFATGDGISVTTHAGGSSVVTQQAAISVTIAPGSEVPFGPRVFSVASESSAILIKQSVTCTIHISNVHAPALATFVASSSPIIAYRQSSVVVLIVGNQILTAHLGDAVTMNFHRIDVATDDIEFVVGPSTIGMPTDDGHEEGRSTAVWKSDGSIFTAVMQD